MGEITRMVRRYTSGEIGYDELERFYVNFPIQPRWGNQPDWPKDDINAQWGYMERNAPDVEDTEMELAECLSRAGLSVEDFKSLKMALSREIERRAKREAENDDSATDAAVDVHVLQAPKP